MDDTGTNRVGSYAEASFIERLIAALRLDTELYRYVSSARETRWQAAGVLLIAGLANGLALTRSFGRAAIAVGEAQVLLSWLLWSTIVWLVALVLRAPRHGSLFRAMAFANAPGALLFLGMLPVVGGVLWVLVGLWCVVATVPGVQAVFAVSRRRAIAISTVVFLLYEILGMVSGYFATA